MPPEEPEPESEGTKVAEHTRRKHSANVIDSPPEGTKIEVVEHTLAEEELTCNICGEQMEQIGKEIVKTLVIRPRQVSIREDVYYSYACKNCDATGTQTPFTKAPKAAKVIPGSYASPEAVAYMMTQKFMMGNPIYRMEQDFKRQGIELSRQTMSNWMLKATELWLTPVYEALHQKLVQEKGKSMAKTASQQGSAYCSKLFNLEKKLAKVSAENRYEERLKQEKPILDAFLAWAETIQAAPKSKLGLALTYLRNQWPYLQNYLLDGRLELDNNRAERSIKPFVIARKNFLFAITPRGAQASATMFSLIETAKENKLDPFRYLAYIFEMAPTLDQSEPDWVAKLLPENAPAECSVNYRDTKIKKP